MKKLLPQVKFKILAMILFLFLQSSRLVPKIFFLPSYPKKGDKVTLFEILMF